MKTTAFLRNLFRILTFKFKKGSPKKDTTWSKRPTFTQYMEHVLRFVENQTDENQTLVRETINRRFNGSTSVAQLNRKAEHDWITQFSSADEYTSDEAYERLARLITNSGNNGLKQRHEAILTRLAFI